MLSKHKQNMRHLNARLNRLELSFLSTKRSRGGLEHFDDDADACPICMEPFVDAMGMDRKHLVKQLPCKHALHRDCAADWFSQKKRCPTCRGGRVYSDPIYADPDAAAAPEVGIWTPPLNATIIRDVRMIERADPGTYVVINDWVWFLDDEGEWKLVGRKGFMDGEQVHPSDLTALHPCIMSVNIDGLDWKYDSHHMKYRGLHEIWHVADETRYAPYSDLCAISCVREPRDIWINGVLYHRTAAGDWSVVDRNGYASRANIQAYLFNLFSQDRYGAQCNINGIHYKCSNIGRGGILLTLANWKDEGGRAYWDYQG